MRKFPQIVFNERSKQRTKKNGWKVLRTFDGKFIAVEYSCEASTCFGEGGGGKLGITHKVNLEKLYQFN
jgi:hypothetical protein